MNPTRVLVVEDSLTVRTHLRRLLSKEPGIEVIGEAADGASALEMCERLRPDVVTMDLMLPGMSGLAAIEQIMGNCPVPILVVSSPGNRMTLVDTCEAVAAGAVDVLDKPGPHGMDEEWERRLVSALKMVARVSVIHHPRAHLTPPVDPLAQRRFPAAAAATAAERGGDATYDVVALGTSTGGPAALVEVLRALPPDFAVPVLLVVHIGESFSRGFARWLSGQAERRVRFAERGEQVSAIGGQVVMAPPGAHLVVRRGRLQLETTGERNSCRPSVDVLFEAVAHEYGPYAAAALLTGMGTDGADGLLDIRRSGGLTIAQDEATSAVYGMPRQAALIGAAELILPLQSIGAEIGGLRSSHRKVVHRG